MGGALFSSPNEEQTMERSDRGALPKREAVAEGLTPALERAKSTLRDSLREACRANVDRADTGELIRIEEVLAIANEAAKEAISVRRRLRGERRRRSRTSGAIPQSSIPPTSRVIRAPDGNEWTVFAVYPSSRTARAGVRDAFTAGWLTFDSAGETRRLAPIPEQWDALSDDELLRLAETAEPSTRHRRSKDSPGS
jgi:hypothetical protein